MIEDYMKQNQISVKARFIDIHLSKIQKYGLSVFVLKVH